MNINNYQRWFMDNKYNHHNRWKCSLKVHIVLVTKHRKQLLKVSIADDVKQKIFDIANTRGYEIIAIETDKDHIHFLLSYDTADRVCNIVKIVKQETTYYLWKSIVRSNQNSIGRKNILVRWLFCLQHRRSVISNYAKIYWK